MDNALMAQCEISASLMRDVGAQKNLPAPVGSGTSGLTAVFWGPLNRQLKRMESCLFDRFKNISHGTFPL